MSRGESIRAVERAIELLRVLGRRPQSTLQQLHDDTDLPKPTIVRLLRTLETAGFVAQNFNYGKYQLLGAARSLSSGFHHDPMVLEAAERVMVDFTKGEGWPLALGLFDHDAMVVRICTIPHTTQALEHSMLNRRLSLTDSAMGRAYLAMSTPHERKFLLEILRSGSEANCDLENNIEFVERMIQQARECGFATQDPRVANRSSSIAVPIRANQKVIACLEMTWISNAMAMSRAVAQFVPKLFKIADDVSIELARITQGYTPTPTHFEQAV